MALEKYTPMPIMAAEPSSARTSSTTSAILNARHRACLLADVAKPGVGILLMPAVSIEEAFLTDSRMWYGDSLLK